MRRAVLAVAILAVVAVSIYVGVAGLGAEQQFRYGVTNDSSGLVIVRFGAFGRFQVAAGVSGRAASSFGIFRYEIEILDVQCRVLETIEATTQSGSLWIQDDAPARLAEIPWAEHATHQLTATEKCEA